MAMEIYQTKLSTLFPVGVGHCPSNSKRTSKFFPRVVAMKTNSDYKTEKSESKSTNRMFILGMGFVGQFLAQSLKKEGWVVAGTCTSMSKKERLEEKGFDVCVFDANQPELSTLNALKCYTHLLIAVPPVACTGDPLLQHEKLLRSTLMDGNLRWLCYLSSTSVYGHCGGAWVNEDAVDTIIKQEPLSEGQKMRSSRQYTSRVHVEDICQALIASIYMPSSRRIYNIVDDDPAPREEVFAYAEDLIEKKWPGCIKQKTYSSSTVTSANNSNLRGDKRVSNARIKKELGVMLLHPSYGSGLRSIIDQMENPFHKCC